MFEHLEKMRQELAQQHRWDARFMRVTQEIATWSSCIRPGRQVGAVIVKDKRILTTGYNGAPSGIESCAEKNQCLRELAHIESGTRQEVCFAIHAEQNALLQAAKLGISVDGSTLYCTHQPCSICAKQIINAGIKRVVYLEGYPDDFALKLLHEANVQLDKFDTSNTSNTQQGA
ncbi:deoxycytidylate deaminase [Ruminococcus sp.]|uniref:deoxycytidylate deaminase n=1 Tax=Ruminococcus sp. TaxID=41978 RepID=UPI003AF033E6